MTGVNEMEDVHAEMARLTALRDAWRTYAFKGGEVPTDPVGPGDRRPTTRIEKLEQAVTDARDTLRTRLRQFEDAQMAWARQEVRLQQRITDLEALVARWMSISLGR